MGARLWSWSMHEEFVRLVGERTGELLIQALQASPYLQVEIEGARVSVPVRAVVL